MADKDIKDDQLNDLLEEALNDMLNDKPKKTVAEKEIPKPSTARAKTSKQQKFEDDPEKSMDKFFADMKKELDSIDPAEAQAKMNETVPEIFDLMQNLLSKELLYPALKDLSPKFDEWLQKNNETLSKSDKKRYSKQRDIINEIIEVFDDESLGNQDRFVKNLDLMEKMQSLGAPPSELTVPDGMSKCSVM